MNQKHSDSLLHFTGSSAFYTKFSNIFKFSPKSVNPQSQVILAAGDFNRYIELPNHKELIKISQKYGSDNCLCESRQNSKMANLFFDYDCKDEPNTFAHAMNTIDDLKAKIKAIFPQLIIKFYVKDSLQPDNESLINSIHIITHLSTQDGHSIYFDYSNGCSQIKFFVSKLGLSHPFDHKQAYSGHLLRLLHSNKFDKSGHITNRIFNESDMSDIQDEPLKSLSSYCPNPKFMLVSDYLNQNFMLQYVKNQGYAKDYLLEHIRQRDNESHLSLTLTEQHTPVCQHRSNNAVCMLYNQGDNHNIIIKCQDEECGKFFQTFFRYDDNRHRCQIFTTGDNSFERPSSSGSNSTKQSSNSVAPTKNSKSNNPIKNSMQKIVLNISKDANQDSGYVIDNVDHIEQDGYSAEASPPSNNLFKTLVNNQKCSFVGKDNYHHYTINGVEYKMKFSKDLIKDLKQLSRRYDRQELLEMGVVFNQYNFFVNNTINIINNNTNKEEVVYDDAFDEIEFPSETHKEYFISIINDDFQFITEIYNLDFPNQFIYVYDENDKGSVMFFDNSDESGKINTDGGCWTTSGGLKFAKQKIRNHVVKFFNSIIQQFEPKDPSRKIAQFKLKSVRSVFKNNTEFDQYLMETYFNKRIKFNNNYHYLHFQNGTFDLEQRKLIKTVPEMYNTFQIRYDFDETIPYDEIYQQLSQTMQKNEFHWFLKQLSNCLNPRKVIEEKQLVILTGKGNNGKTLFCKLMHETLDQEAYSLSTNHQMIQGPSTSSNSATPNTKSLLYKRYCYVAELEKQLAFNQQEAKIITGGEKIQARDLFKSLITFQPYAGLFISCNQIPNIDTSDGGFINRLKIIDMKYQFMKDPKHQFQKPINKQLTSLIETTQWKQGFMNLLINYYYKPIVQLPKSIQKSIDLRVNIQQNPVHDWAEDNIQYQLNTFVLAEDLRQKYLEDNDNSKIARITFNKLINEYIYQNPQIFQDVDFKKIDRNDDLGDRVVGQAFINCCFKCEKIQTRDLYKSLITFQPCSGIFISCNQIPHIDTTDGGFMNRLKIIDLKYQFIKTPQHQFQKPINKQLLRLIQTIQWKQGFMNLLINYYYKPEIELPKNIQKSIDLRENLQQNPIHSWAQDKIQFQLNQFVLAEEIRQLYISDTDNNIGKTSFNKQLNDYIQQNPQIFPNVDFKKVDRRNKDNERFQGYQNQGQEIQRSIKIRLSLTEIQKKILKKWYNHYRFCYNRALSYMNQLSENNNQPKYDITWDNYYEKIQRCSIGNVGSFSKFELRSQVAYLDKNENLPWLRESPMTIKEGAVFEAYKNRQACFTNLKNGNIGHFNMQYLRKKQQKWSMNISKDNLSKDKSNRKRFNFYSKTLNSHSKFKTLERLPDQFCQQDCKVHFDGWYYYLIVPVKKTIQNIEDRQQLCSLDPGIITFQTLYDPQNNKSIKIGHQSGLQIFRRLLLLDRLVGQNRNQVTKKQKLIQQQKIVKLRNRVQNLQLELHNKACNYLCKTYNQIIIPKFDSKELSKKQNRSLRTKTVRKMVVLAHSKFYCKLINKAEELGCEIIEQEESYTSKTCCNCNNIKNNLGSARIYNCTQCNTVVDRDINGSINILRKNDGQGLKTLT